MLFPISMASLAKHLWSWWISGLQQCLPAPVRRFWTKPAPCQISFPTEGTVQIQIHPNQKLPIEKIEQLKSKIEKRPLELILLHNQYLTTCFYLPAAAEKTLRQVISYELDRYTPFSAQQVYLAYKNTRVDKKLRITIALVPRNLLDSKLKLLHNAGLFPTAVRCETLPELDLMPKHQRHDKSRWQRSINLGLLGLCFLLIINALLIPLRLQHLMIQNLETQLHKDRHIVKELGLLKQRINRLRQEIIFATVKKQSSPSMLILLKDLSERLPKNTWLNGFNYHHQQLELEGHSTSSSKLIEILEASPYFKNTHFLSPLIREPATNTERFRLGIEIDHAQEDSFF